MEEELISKKELLALTGISYGSLYRWKRKQLIPEEWFIKKSTFTGPETFFPRSRMLERIAKIQEMKENLSLDDLALTFSASPIALNTNAQRLIDDGTLSGAIAQLPLVDTNRNTDFLGILNLFLCDELLRDGHLSAAEANEVLGHLLADGARFGAPPILSIYRKMGVVFSVLAPDTKTVRIDPSARPIVTIQIEEAIESLKRRLEKHHE